MEIPVEIVQVLLNLLLK